MSGAPVGGELGPDSSAWDSWWRFNREPYLRLRSRARGVGHGWFCDDFFMGRGEEVQRPESLRPSDAFVRERVVPALLEVLRTERQNDLVTGALIALAKIGDVASKDGTSEFVDVIEGFLRSADYEQEVNETAALALGILADDRAVPTLVSLMRSDARGRRLVGKNVPFRTRAFAAVGLGLTGHKSANAAVRRSIAGHLVDAIEMSRGAQPDLKVAAVSALGLIPLDWRVNSGPSVLDPTVSVAVDRQAMLGYLVQLMNPDTRGEDGGEPDFRVRAQVPIAAARLLMAEGGALPASALPARQRVIDRLLGLVDSSSRESKVEVLQSATIALGMIGSAGVTAPEDAQNQTILTELLRISRQSADNQTEYFALMALAQMGSRRGADGGRSLQPIAQKALLSALSRGRGQKRPWAALAIGVFGSAIHDSGLPTDADLTLAVRDVAIKAKNPSIIGAYAIALGMLKDVASLDMLVGFLEGKQFSTDDSRGSIAVGLGLMEARSALPVLSEMISKARFRPVILRRAATGLALLGDKAAVGTLVSMLGDMKGLAAQASIASALGLIGDESSVEPLTKMLLGHSEQRTTDVARAFAAVALGIVCDKEVFPWNAKLSINANYRANVQTMTNERGDGILDVL